MFKVNNNDTFKNDGFCPYTGKYGPGNILRLTYQAGNHMFKGNNRNTKRRYDV